MNQSYKTALRIFILNICTALVCGCSTDNYRMQKYDPKAQATNDKAIVILGTKNVTFMDFTKFTNADLKPKLKPKVEAQQQAAIPATASIDDTKTDHANPSADPNKANYPSIKLSDIFNRKLETRANNSDSVVQNTYRVLKANRLLNYGYAKSIYTIEPGIYYISYAYSDEGTVERHTSAVGLTEKGAIEYGAFEVKPGEVVYLGDIEIDWLRNDPHKMISVSGDLNVVKDELLAADYQELAKKLKPGKFLASGTNIMPR